MNDEIPFRQVLGPNNYPTTCTPDLTARIADMVLAGASIDFAAAACAVSRQRMRQWLQWGFEGYNENRMGEHEVFVGLYVAVLQAVGISMVELEVKYRKVSPLQWLHEHPESRNIWGVVSERAMLPAAPTDEKVAVPDGSATPLSELREILKGLVEIGTFVEPTKFDEQTEEVVVEGDGTPPAEYGEDQEADHDVAS